MRERARDPRDTPFLPMRSWAQLGSALDMRANHRRRPANWRGVAQAALERGEKKRNAGAARYRLALGQLRATYGSGNAAWWTRSR